MKACLFPGQGSQFVGMAKAMLESNPKNENLLLEANDVLGFDIYQVMLNGNDEELKATKVTQPAVFLYSYSRFLDNVNLDDIDAVAGHSLGEITALVANETLSFTEGLKIVSKRAQAMQKSCEEAESTMAAILGLEDKEVIKICAGIDNLVAANFNCPGQVVISGSKTAVSNNLQTFLDNGARRAIKLKVSGAFHSPFMQSAEEELKEAIEQSHFKTPKIAIYQNVSAKKISDPEVIQKNLIAQLTSPVLWTKSMEAMVNDGITEFVEVGAKVLSGFFRKYDRSLELEQFL